MKYLSFRDSSSGVCPACGKPQWDYCVNPSCPVGSRNNKDYNY